MICEKTSPFLSKIIGEHDFITRKSTITVYLDFSIKAMLDGYVVNSIHTNFRRASDIKIDIISGVGQGYPTWPIIFFIIY